MNTNPVTTGPNPQGGHMIPNMWVGIGTAGHVAVFVILALIVIAGIAYVIKR